jgi:hypothetical protein
LTLAEQRAARRDSQECTGAISSKRSNVSFHGVSFPVSSVTCSCSNPHAFNSSCLRVGHAFCVAMLSVASTANA